MWSFWFAGWLFTGEYDSKEYGFWDGLWLGLYWPLRLAEILKEKELMK